MKCTLAARGGQDAGITQTRDHSLPDPYTYFHFMVPLSFLSGSANQVLLFGDENHLHHSAHDIPRNPFSSAISSAKTASRTTDGRQIPFCLLCGKETLHCTTLATLECCSRLSEQDLKLFVLLGNPGGDTDSIVKCKSPDLTFIMGDNHNFRWEQVTKHVQLGVH